MNILILSSGTRNKIVEYFRKALAGKGKVICTDMSELAPSIYLADKHYIVPRMTEPGYVEVILDICKSEKIEGVISLIDPELSLLAANKERFTEIGTKVIGSTYNLCEMSLDKYEMYKWLEKHEYNCAKSYMDKEKFYADVETGKVTYPVFVKPARGSASIAISKVYDKETIKKWLSTFFRRFFNQQFKRSCLPDGPKVGSISISPRGDWRMPSDASSTIWLKEIEDL